MSEPDGDPAEATDEPADEPADKATDEPADKATHKPADQATDEPADQATDKPADQATDQATDQPADERPRPRPGTAARATRVSRRAQQTAAPVTWWRRGPVLLVAAVLLTVVAIAASVVALRRHDQSPAAGSTTGSGPRISAAEAAQAFVAGATADIVAVTAYDYRSLDIALRAAEDVTTGSYREAYRRAIQGSLGQQARAQRIVQTFRQTAAGIGEMSSDLRTAKVLVFGVQTVRRGDAAPQDTAITLTATVRRVGDRYLISRLDAGTNAGVPAGSARVADAAETARRHVVAALTLRRASLDADAAAILADTVNPLRAELVSSLPGEKRTVTKGNYDLTGRATAVAIEQARATRVIVLVAATGTRSAAGRAEVVADQRLRVNVLFLGGAWRVSDVAAADS